VVLGVASAQSSNGVASRWVTTWCSSDTRYNSVALGQQCSIRSIIVMVSANEVQHDDDMQYKCGAA